MMTERPHYPPVEVDRNTIIEFTTDDYIKPTKKPPIKTPHEVAVTQPGRMNAIYGIEDHFNQIHTGLKFNAFSCATNCNGQTTVKVKNYCNHYKDPEYIEEHNKIVNGKIVQWRNQTLRIISELVRKKAYTHDELLDQWVFAKEAGDVIVGITKTSKYPLEILNSYAIYKLVEGVETREMAHLVHKMAINSGFKLLVSNTHAGDPPLPKRRIQIITEYQEDESTWSYGFLGEMKPCLGDF